MDETTLKKSSKNKDYDFVILEKENDSFRIITISLLIAIAFLLVLIFFV